MRTMSFHQRPKLLFPAPPTGINFSDGKALEELISRLTDSSAKRHSGPTQCLSFCCVPTGCRGQPTRSDPGGHDDDVRVICSNPQCTAGRWIHSSCFRDWERLMTACVRVFTARGRSDANARRGGGGEDLEIILKACFCFCRKGYLRKDIDYYVARRRLSVMAATKEQPNITTSQGHQGLPPPLPPQQQQQQQKTPKDIGGSSSLAFHFDDSTDGYSKNSFVASFTGNLLPGQVRTRTFSFSSTGSSPSSSTATPPSASPSRSDAALTPSSSPSPSAEVALQSMTSSSSSGNIFRHRPDLSAFRNLPKTIQNPYHIKVEDEGPHGNDKVRGFLLKNLTRSGTTEVHCSVCRCLLPIFDEFPLIDGTFFLSPRHYSDRISTVFDRRMVYLNAVCLGCLDGSQTSLSCVACGTPWDGSTFILGTMYSYDIFAAMSCCSSRSSCSCCHLSVEEPSHLKFFSDFSRMVRCPHCETEDFHFLKELHEVYFVRTASTARSFLSSLSSVAQRLCPSVERWGPTSTSVERLTSLCPSSSSFF